MQEVQEFKTDKGYRISDLINPHTKATIIKIYKPRIKRVQPPYLLESIKNDFSFDLFNKNTYQKFETKILVRIWNKIKHIKVRGQNSKMFEETKIELLKHLKKISVFKKYNEEIFVNQYHFIATLEIRSKSLITLWVIDERIFWTVMPRECSAWTEEDVQNHLVKNFRYSRL